MKQFAALALAFAGLVLAIEALHVATAWWRGELVPGWADWLMLASLPVLLWAWWRHLSPFGRDCGACLPPGDDGDRKPR